MLKSYCKTSLEYILSSIKDQVSNATKASEAAIKQVSECNSERQIQQHPQTIIFKIINNQ